MNKTTTKTRSEAIAFAIRNNVDLTALSGWGRAVDGNSLQPRRCFLGGSNMTAAHPIVQTGIAAQDQESGIPGGQERLISTGRDLMIDVAASGYATVRFSPRKGQQCGHRFSVRWIDPCAPRWWQLPVKPTSTWKPHFCRSVGGDATSVIDMNPPFLIRLSSQDAAVSGIGLSHTRLGIMGSGFVAFFGRDLRLDSGPPLRNPPPQLPADA